MIKISLLILAAGALLSAAQVADLYTPSELSDIRKQLATGQRFGSKDLQNYSNHHTMLAYREATGSSEIHEHEADVFFVVDGDARIVTGGKMVGSHIEKAGELRGTSIEGGETRPLKTGDIVHIPAGMAHQILVTEGKPITYFVVKISGQ